MTLMPADLTPAERAARLRARIEGDRDSFSGIFITHRWMSARPMAYFSLALAEIGRAEWFLRHDQRNYEPGQDFEEEAAAILSRMEKALGGKDAE